MQINITTEEDRRRAVSIIQTKAAPFSVKVGKITAVRGLTANALYWVWVTEISLHTGNSKDATHELNKDRFLSKIFERDDPEYAEMMQTLRDLYKVDQAKALQLRKAVIGLTSTTKATKEQMSEFMQDVKIDAFDNLGMILTSE